MPRLGVSPASLVPLALFAALDAGCATRWTVVTQADPDPMVGAREFFVEPIHFDPPMVGEKTEAEYLADKSPAERDAWAAGKAETSRSYAEALARSAPTLRFLRFGGPGVFVVRPQVPSLDPGASAYASKPTQMVMRLQVLGSGGAVIDEVAVRASVPASVVNAAAGARMRQAGEDLGKVTGQYLLERAARP